MATVTGQRIADFLGGGDDDNLIELADNHIEVLTQMCLAYTRGAGFSDGAPNEQIAAVILSATARMIANPGQIAYDVGGVSIRGGFQGFNIAERIVLNRFRKTAQ